MTHEEAIFKAAEYAGSVPPHEGVIDTDASWQSLSKAMDAPAITAKVSTGKSLGRWAGYAVIAVLVSIVSIETGRNIWPSKSDVTEYRTLATARGQRARVQLPDGSTALLAPETRIRYASDFGKSSRTVELDGQALFTVTHAEGAPFTVSAGPATTRVLGTSFSIRKYADDSTTQVIVAEGKVSVANSHSASPAILTSGGSASVSKQGIVAIERSTDVASALAWTQGRLEFTRTPLSAVVSDASRMYNMDIRISSPKLASQLVTGVIDQPSPDDAVAMLAATFGVRAERRGNTITLMER